MQFSLDLQTRGTRIIGLDEAKNRRNTLNKFIAILDREGFNEISLPSLEPTKVYVDKAGDEILNQMYVFKDKGDRDICLRPEGTATIQLLAQKYYKTQKDVKLWYFEKCWRYERVQTGRYREFYQLGVEVINPSKIDKAYLTRLAMELVTLVTDEAELAENVVRGLSYYVEEGFEVSCPSLGAQKQVLGGGRYKEGIGFAIGFDRIMLLAQPLASSQPGKNTRQGETAGSGQTALQTR